MQIPASIAKIETFTPSARLALRRSVSWMKAAHLRKQLWCEPKCRWDETIQSRRETSRVSLETRLHRRRQKEIWGPVTFPAENSQMGLVRELCLMRQRSADRPRSRVLSSGDRKMNVLFLSLKSGFPTDTFLVSECLRIWISSAAPKIMS